LSWGLGAVVYSEKAMKRLLSFDIIPKEIDLFLWDKVTVINPDGSQINENLFESYVTKKELIGLNVFESAITEMGRSFG